MTLIQGTGLIGDKECVTRRNFFSDVLPSSSEVEGNGSSWAWYLLPMVNYLEKSPVRGLQCHAGSEIKGSL